MSTCGREDETVLHVLWLCLAAVDVWSVGCKIFQKWPSDGRDFIQLVEKVLQRCDIEDTQLFVEIACQVWLRRNDFVFGNNFLHSNILVQNTKDHVAEFIQVTERSKNNRHNSVVIGGSNWMAPETRWLKANWDASFSKNQGWMGLGAVVRDETRMVIATECKSVVGALDPTVAEARAVLLTIQLCRERGFTKVHFEGDTQNVVSAVHLRAVDWSSFGLMVEDIRLDLQAIPLWKMTHVRRERNCAAHSLSKFATINFVDRQWLFQSLECILDIVRMEQSALPSSDS